MNRRTIIEGGNMEKNPLLIWDGVGQVPIHERVYFVDSYSLDINGIKGPMALFNRNDSYACRSRIRIRKKKERKGWRSKTQKNWRHTKGLMEFRERKCSVLLSHTLKVFKCFGLLWFGFLSWNMKNEFKNIKKKLEKLKRNEMK